MRYVFFTFNGYSMPMAKRLQDEGNEVLVAQIARPDSLGIDGWQSQKEDPEVRRRRLSLYDGILDKKDAEKVLRDLAWDADRGRNQSATFVVADHNNLCKFAERVARLGYTGLLPDTSDYEREKDREASQEFVNKHYNGQLKVIESQSLKSAEDGIAIVEGSDKLWVLKSHGNLAETIVPKTMSLELNHAQIIGALQREAKDYEKGGFLIEQKIRQPIEFTPEIAFWDGEPIYSQVEIECKPIGAGDVGRDGGGAINLVVKTSLRDEISKRFFPEAVFAMAKKRKGLFIFDAGILYDPETKAYFFTEFAGNRWSWGGAYSEMAMAQLYGKTASNYFESVAKGENPLRRKFGATVTMYNTIPDLDHADCQKEGIPVVFDEALARNLNFYQIKASEDGGVENVGYNDPLFAYISGSGDDLKHCIDMTYRAVDAVSFKEVLYRYKVDYLSKDYSSSIPNRLDFLTKQKLIQPID